MAMTYTQLIAARGTEGSIKNWVNRTDIPVEDVLLDAQMELFTRLRVREMRAAATVTGTLASRTAALPTGYLDSISFKDRYFCNLTLMDMDALINRRANNAAGTAIQGEPTAYSVFDELIQFDCALNAALSYSMLYFKSPTLLSASNTTNWLTTRYPHLLRFALRKHAEIYAKNWEASDRAEKDLEGAMIRIEQHDDLSYRGASPPER